MRLRGRKQEAAHRRKTSMVRSKGRLVRSGFGESAAQRDVDDPTVRSVSEGKRKTQDLPRADDGQEMEGKGR